MFYGILVLTWLITLQSCSTYGKNVAQLDEKFDKMFNIIENTKNSRIGNCVSVTHDDLTVDMLIMTNDGQNFEKYSKIIPPQTQGTDLDCATHVKIGILLALKNSIQGSTLFIFMDTDTCVITDYDGIRSLALLRDIQMTFITTADCESRRTPDFQSYFNLGNDTVRKVLPISKSKVIQTLDYVMEGRYLLAYEISDAHSYIFNYTVENQFDDVIISIAGSNMESIVIKTSAPDGSKANITLIFLDKEFMILRLTQLQIGVYITEINSESETYVKVTGKSNINFQCGFSPVLPNSLIETAARPAADRNSFLSIQICTKGINLTTARVEDMNGNTLEELSLRTPSGDEKFFVSNCFDPPRTMFRIAVEGYDVKTKAPIFRKSEISFERRNPNTEKQVPVAPRITIERWPKIITKYNVTYQLKCRAQGYPTPYISWHEKDSGKMLPAQSLPIEDPYDYISILNIGEPYKNITYECRAWSSSGQAKKDIQVEVHKYIHVVQASQGYIKVKYEHEVTIFCEIDAYPPVTKIWYRNNNILTSDSNTVISKDNSSVTIKQMNFETKGKYRCEATSDLDTLNFYTHLILYGVARPKIVRTQGTVHVLHGNDVELVCHIVKAVVPKAMISWLYSQSSGEVYQEKNETCHILYLKNVTSDQSGIYSCTTSNYLGSDYYSIELIVDYPPTSTKDVIPLQVKVGSVLSVPCNVYGVPSPKIEWFHNNIRVQTTSSILLTTRKNIKFTNITQNDAGNYTCLASNEYGFLQKTFTIEVFSPVYIKSPAISAQNVKVNQSLILTCEAYGYPEPEIKWIYNDFYGERRMQQLSEGAVSFVIQELKLKDEGYYTCIASNKYDSSRLTYQITVDGDLDKKG